jgi:rod shape-determining protein MreD
MAINWFRQVLFFLILVMLQVWIFNKIHIFSVATPLFYIYYILKLPVNINRNGVLILSFLIGFFIDMFAYTYGFHMLACTVAGFIRHHAFRLFLPKELVEFDVPSIRDFGVGLFFRYIVSIVLIHHIVFYIVESLSLFDPLRVLSCIFGSAVLTIVLIFIAEGLTFGRFKK